ncbi:glyoxalase [Flavobacterium sp.]|uniref:glyoxalase n=1 Tax=Flavobacterium sp. TaxID=239 RepID=UPI000EDE89FC|nr:glyoxalase [Flavobacterium sp.]HCQ12555.1 glyoxalase [Flavobacterium sp.]
MQHKAKSIRPFIGSENFETSRNFYTYLGFQEVVLAHNMSLFQNDTIGFYLQDAYVKDWIDNTMVFMEVEDVEEFWNNLVAINLTSKYPSAKLIPMKSYDWGKECFLIDPSGILWHFGTFSTK